uniref:Uncharacterized protein n=1 Tax=Dicentrarchus labrax TaxID=13489 RepID=A0A8P4G1U1_DICLA
MLCSDWTPFNNKCPGMIFTELYPMQLKHNQIPRPQAIFSHCSKVKCSLSDIWTEKACRLIRQPGGNVWFILT